MPARRAACNPRRRSHDFLYSYPFIVLFPQLATVVADWDAAKDRIAAADKEATGAARRVTDTALMRLEAARCFQWSDEGGIGE